MSAQYEQFGKYVLLEKLATGGMAEVFLARGTGAGGIGKFFAIKRILPQFADSPEFIEMFKAEAKIAINLNHSNIVSIHEFGVEKGQFFLVMDYVEGRNLRQILNKMKKTSLQFGIDQIVYVIKEVASGLDHAHRCIDGSTGKPLNITHRDMSPQNIMVSFEGEIKIVDFGIAKAESQLETTRAGTLKGKFGYMSPEQAEGQNVDLRTDIFSLGIVLWELLANDRLFVANNEMNTLRKIRDCQIPSLRKINPNIHAELERIALKTLARDRNLRYQTGAALQRDMNRFLNRQYPDFSAQDFSAFIKSVFTDEIMALRKRLMEYAKVNLNITLNLPSNQKTVVAYEAEDSSDSLLSANTSSLVSAPAAAVPAPKDTLEDGLPKEFRFGAEDTFPAAQKHPRPETASGKINIDLVTNSLIENKPGTQTEGAPPVEMDDKTERLSPAQKTGTMILSSAPSNVLPLPESAPTAVVPAAPPPPKPKASSILDENALAAEAVREISVNTDTPDPEAHRPIETEKIIHEKTGDRRVSSRNTSMYEEPIETQSSARLATFLVFALVCFGAYVYLVKYFGNSMVDVIRVTDPVLHELHVALGVDTGQLVPRDPTNLPLPNRHAPPTQEPPAVADEDSTGLIVTSNPSGADIQLNGQNTGMVTPGRIVVPADEKFTVTVHKRGYIEFKKRDVTRSEIGHRLDVTLQKLNIGYLDVEIFPPQEATLYINGKATPLRAHMARQVQIPGNTAISIRAESGNGRTYDEATITVPSDHRRLIKLNPRRLTRTPANSK